MKRRRIDGVSATDYADGSVRLFVERAGIRVAGVIDADTAQRIREDYDGETAFVTHVAWTGTRIALDPTLRAMIVGRAVVSLDNRRQCAAAMVGSYVLDSVSRTDERGPDEWTLESEPATYYPTFDAAVLALESSVESWERGE